MPSNARESLFPDYGLRPQFRELFPHFDPFIFLVQTDRPPFAEEHDLIMRGELKEAKHNVYAKFNSMESDNRLSYILAVTNGLHEIRHFHDYFGTTAGFARVLRGLQDAHEFTATWQELKRQGIVHLPLATWGQSDNAPSVLKEYLSKRRSYVEWVNLFDGSLKAAALPGKTDAEEGIVAYSVGGLEALIPGVPLNQRRAQTGEESFRMVPLGYRALAEGSAFVIQRIAAAEVFGRMWAREVKASQTQGAVDDDNWHLYMAVDFYLSKRLDKFYDRYQLALTDLSLMAAEPAIDEKGHPGWRLSKATTAAKNIGPVYQQSGSDLETFMNKISSRVGWKSVKSVAAQSFNHGNEHLEHIDKRAEPETFWSAMMRAIYNVHLQFMAARRATPSCLAEPVEYFGLLKDLPAPPISSASGQLVFRGLDERDAQAFRTWLFLEHAQRSLLFSTGIPCPINAHPHDCPGDPFHKPRFRWRRKTWTPTAACPFSQFLVNLGIPEVEVEVLER